MLSNFLGDIKQQMFLKLWKFKPNTFMINYFIIKYKLHGMVTQSSNRWVPLRFTTSLFFNVTLCTLKHFWLGTQKYKLYGVVTKSSNH